MHFVCVYFSLSIFRLLTLSDIQSIRQLVTDKINRQEETLTRLIAQRQSAIDDHSSGRKLLTDEGLEYHKNHISSLRRKLAVTKQKDPAVS